MWYNGAGGDFLTHLLVVDDEVSILELIKNSLGKDGYLITSKSCIAMTSFFWM